MTKLVVICVCLAGKPPALATSTLISTPKVTPPPSSTTANLPPSNVMTVNVKTIKTQAQTTTTPKLEVHEDTSPLMTLDDMNLVLTNIQHKLAKTPRNFPKLSTSYYKRGTFRDYIFSRHHTTPLNKRPLEELTIKNKLTRIAKFPIRKRHFKNKRDEMLSQRPIGNDYMSFHEGPLSRESRRELRNRITNEQKMNRANRPGQMTRKSPNEKYRYTDYFNDLLMWHNDILNLDRVPAPVWKSILKNIQAETADGFTTPNMNNLVRELDEINEFLDYDPRSVSRYLNMPNASINATLREADATFTNFRSSHTKDVAKPDLIRSVAMDDKAIVTSKDLLIKGEAKFFQYNKPKFDRDVNSKNIIEKLNIHRKNVDSGIQGNKGKILNEILYFIWSRVD